MGTRTGIEWTDATWNPVTGCTRVSPGCDHCYAFALHDQRYAAHKDGRWPAAPAQYHAPFSLVQVLPGRLHDPEGWARPLRIFVASMGDLFHRGVPDDHLDQVLAVMARCSHHTFQVLTKRPERAYAYLRDSETPQRISAQIAAWAKQSDCLQELEDWPLPNLWLGSSVEDQEAADARIPWLLTTPAALRFLSCEPLLGPLNLARAMFCSPECNPADGHADHAVAGIDWVICGGETGRRFRPLDLDAARSLRDQCQQAAVPFFFKHASGSVPYRAPRELDGVRWDEFPRPRQAAPV